MKDKSVIIIQARLGLLIDCSEKSFEKNWKIFCNRNDC